MLDEFNISGDAKYPLISEYPHSFNSFKGVKLAS